VADLNVLFGGTRDRSDSYRATGPTATDGQAPNPPAGSPSGTTHLTLCR